MCAQIMEYLFIQVYIYLFIYSPNLKFTVKITKQIIVNAKNY